MDSQYIQHREHGFRVRIYDCIKKGGLKISKNYGGLALLPLLGPLLK